MDILNSSLFLDILKHIIEVWISIIHRDFWISKNVFQDIHNSIMDIHNSFMDIHNSFKDIHNSFRDIHNSFMDIQKH